MWWHPHEFEKKRPFLEQRIKLLRAVKAFFDEKGFLEVETPALQVCPVMDTHIHGLKTEVFGPDMAGKRDLYLHTSPEFDMKKLLVAGLPRIYQICNVFRNGEGSPLHTTEFTMIEWYRANVGYREIMDDSIELLRHVARTLHIHKYRYGGTEADPFLNWNIISVCEAFEKYADIKLENYLDDTPAFASAIEKQGIRVAEGDRWDDLFFRVMASKIEPHLGINEPCILYDYPVCMASLARKKPEDQRFAERFEIYVCGVELANGFGELTDAAEQRMRFKEDMALKKQIYGTEYPPDEEFFKALEYGLPPSGGIALGIDRLVMLATGAGDITQVLWAGKP